MGTKAQGLNETTGGGPDEVADKPREDSALGAEIYETTEGTITLRGDTDNDKVCSLRSLFYTAVSKLVNRLRFQSANMSIWSSESTTFLRY